VFSAIGIGLTQKGAWNLPFSTMNTFIMGKLMQTVNDRVPGFLTTAAQGLFVIIGSEFIAV